jgi:hypothetical protein
LAGPVKGFRGQRSFHPRSTVTFLVPLIVIFQGCIPPAEHATIGYSSDIIVFIILEELELVASMAKDSSRL